MYFFAWGFIGFEYMTRFNKFIIFDNSIISICRETRGNNLLVLFVRGLQHVEQNYHNCSAVRRYFIQHTSAITFPMITVFRAVMGDVDILDIFTAGGFLKTPHFVRYTNDKYRFLRKRSIDTDHV